MNTTFNFQDGNGPVPAHRHKNPDGSEGGWVAETTVVDSNVYIGKDALVYQKVCIAERAQIRDTARVFGSAWVLNRAIVLNDVHIHGFACVPRDVKVSYGCYSKGVVSGPWTQAIKEDPVESHRQNLLKVLDLKDDSSMEDIIKLVESMHIAASRHTQQIHAAEAAERSWQAKFHAVQKLTETCLDQADQIRELRERLSEREV